MRNWHEYDRALVARGSLTLWLDEDFAQQHWVPERTGKAGRPVECSDEAIQTLLVMKQVFHLTYRSLEGMAKSLMRLMCLDFKVPDHSHMPRRAQALQVRIPRLPTKGPVHMVVDSTGLKVFGEGEWKVRQHGVGKRRTWIKVHLGVDAASKETIAVEVTTTAWGDGEVLPGLLEQFDADIDQVSADGGYDTKECHQAIMDRNAKAAIPPRQGAKLWEEGHPRNKILAEIAAVGEEKWKENSGYHRRSLAENAMYRLKQLFGDKLKSREFARQVVETHCRVAAMNIMTAMGMPMSVVHRNIPSENGKTMAQPA